MIVEITDPNAIARILEHIAVREAGEGTTRAPPLVNTACR
jgi:hypothetical protein